MSDKIMDMEGTIVSEEYVSKHLGFSSIEEFRKWSDAGSPVGRCCNDYCYRPAFWPHLEEPCQYCGSPVKII